MGLKQGQLLSSSTLDIVAFGGERPELPTLTAANRLQQQPCLSRTCPQPDATDTHFIFSVVNEFQFCWSHCKVCKQDQGQRLGANLVFSKSKGRF